MSILDNKIDFILSKEDFINTSLMTRSMRKQDLYGKINTKLSLEITKLMFILKSKDWFGDNTKLALYQKLLDMTRKQGLIFKIPETEVVYQSTIYYGVDVPGLLEGDISSTLNSGSSDKADNTYIYNTTGTEVYYYAYPREWGHLSKIYDDNGYNTINGYYEREVQINIGGINKDYYLMEFMVVSSTLNFDITFVF